MDLDEDFIVPSDLGRRERRDVILRGFAVCCESNCSHGSGRHSLAAVHSISKHYRAIRLGGQPCLLTSGCDITTLSLADCLL